MSLGVKVSCGIAIELSHGLVNGVYIEVTRYNKVKFELPTLC